MTLLAQVVANHVNQGAQARHALTLSSRVRDFTRMNPLMFYGSKVEKNPTNPSMSIQDPSYHRAKFSLEG